jgi:alkylation response protein AidB-like acyl-CoA dehydrogenase
MPVDPSLLEIATRVGAFHITERAMKRAQSAIEAAIANGLVDDSTRGTYLREVRRYFEAFDREAREQLRDVDRRLERINQIHFNLTAERGVAVKRIEGTQGVLDALASVDGTPA